MLYIGTGEELPPSSSADLSIEPVDAARQGVKQWFTHPAVRFVGAHTGCSCGFPSVIAESPLEYYEGMVLQSDDRLADLRSVRALIELVGRVVAHSIRVELYPVADGEESMAPRGVIEWQLRALEPERLFFNERFMHVVSGAGILLSAPAGSAAALTSRFGDSAAPAALPAVPPQHFHRLPRCALRIKPFFS